MAKYCAVEIDTPNLIKFPHLVMCVNQLTDEWVSYEICSRVGYAVNCNRYQITPLRKSCKAKTRIIFYCDQCVTKKSSHFCIFKYCEI